MKRQIHFDLIKGMAILIVYLGHSILYHPINMAGMYSWCGYMLDIIISFNMPLFFLVSGYLFSKTKRSTSSLYESKIKRILIPYIFTMSIIVCCKLLLPQNMSYNAQDGILSMIYNILFQGGDRWFVYTLFIIYLFLIPCRNIIKEKWIGIIICMLLVFMHYTILFPNLFRLSDVVYYMLFFIIGFMLNESYDSIKKWSLKNSWFVFIIFIIQCFCIRFFKSIPFVYDIILPIVGSWFIITLSLILEKYDKNVIVRYIDYSGRYSLQFYLLTFAYPIIRIVIVSVLHITNPVLIIISVFGLQLIAITVIIEITRRIKWLKIPCGY